MKTHPCPICGLQPEIWDLKGPVPDLLAHDGNLTPGDYRLLCQMTCSFNVAKGATIAEAMNNWNELVYSHKPKSQTSAQRRIDRKDKRNDY